MKTVQTQSQRYRIQLLAVLAIGIAGLAAVSLWRWDLVRDIYLADAKNILLNGAIVALFAAGVGSLLRAFGHYDAEEKQLDDFLAAAQKGARTGDPLDLLAPGSIIARRYEEIKDLFERRIPIHHGALSAIMVAEQGVWSSFARFVNQVLILTGVFGTMVSLLFALVGAGRTLGSAAQAEGVAMMLSGMNTALNTSVTAMTGFFVFSYFYGRLTDVQTRLFSGIEKAVLHHIIPRFAFDTEAVNHQTAQLIRQLQALIGQVQKGTGFITETLSGLTLHNTRSLEKLEALIQRHDAQLAGTAKVVEGLERVENAMVEGFRLKPQR